MEFLGSVRECAARASQGQARCSSRAIAQRWLVLVYDGLHEKKKAEDVPCRRNADVVAMQARRGCRTYRTGAVWLGLFMLRDTSCCWVSMRSCTSA